MFWLLNQFLHRYRQSHFSKGVRYTARKLIRQRYRPNRVEQAFCVVVFDESGCNPLHISKRQRCFGTDALLFQTLVPLTFSPKNLCCPGRNRDSLSCRIYVVLDGPEIGMRFSKPLDNLGGDQDCEQLISAEDMRVDKHLSDLQSQAEDSIHAQQTAIQERCQNETNCFASCCRCRNHPDCRCSHWM